MSLDSSQSIPVTPTSAASTTGSPGTPGTAGLGPGGVGGQHPLAAGTSSAQTSGPGPGGIGIGGGGLQPPGLLAVAGESRIDKVRKLLSSPLTNRRKSSCAPPVPLSNRVFGAPLEILAHQHNPIPVFPCSSSVDKEPNIPYVVTRLCRYLIDSNGIAQEGVFRISGNAKLIDRLRSSFDTFGDAPLEQEADTAAAAALLKLFLRELPDPIISRKMYPLFINAVKDLPGEGAGIPHVGSKRDAAINTLHDLIHSLPLENFALLQYLCAFLFEVAAQESTNRMGFTNLGSMFGPNIFRITTEDYTILKEQSITNQIVSIMIQEVDIIFGGPPLSSGEPLGPSESGHTFSRQSSLSPSGSGLVGHQGPHGGRKSVPNIIGPHHSLHQLPAPAASPMLRSQKSAPAGHLEGGADVDEGSCDLPELAAASLVISVPGGSQDPHHPVAGQPQSNIPILTLDTTAITSPTASSKLTSSSSMEPKPQSLRSSQSATTVQQLQQQQQKDSRRRKDTEVTCVCPLSSSPGPGGLATRSISEEHLSGGESDGGGGGGGVAGRESTSSSRCSHDPPPGLGPGDDCGGRGSGGSSVPLLAGDSLGGDDRGDEGNLMMMCDGGSGSGSGSGNGRADHHDDGTQRSRADGGTQEDDCDTVMQPNNNLQSDSPQIQNGAHNNNVPNLINNNHHHTPDKNTHKTDEQQHKKTSTGKKEMDLQFNFSDDVECDNNNESSMVDRYTLERRAKERTQPTIVIPRHRKHSSSSSGGGGSRTNSGSGGGGTGSSSGSKSGPGGGRMSKSYGMVFGHEMRPRYIDFEESDGRDGTMTRTAVDHRPRVEPDISPVCSPDPVEVYHEDDEDEETDDRSFEERMHRESISESASKPVPITANIFPSNTSHRLSHPLLELSPGENIADLIRQNRSKHRAKSSPQVRITQATPYSPVESSDSSTDNRMKAFAVEPASIDINILHRNPDISRESVSPCEHRGSWPLDPSILETSHEEGTSMGGSCSIASCPAEPFRYHQSDSSHLTLSSGGGLGIRKANSYDAPLSPSAFRGYLNHRQRSRHLTDEGIPPTPPVDHRRQLDQAFTASGAGCASPRWSTASDSAILEGHRHRSLSTTASWSHVQHVRQLNKQIATVKRKIKDFERQFEDKYGYRPNYDQKMASSEAQSVMAEFERLKKQLKEIREDAQLMEVKGHVSHVSYAAERLSSLGKQIPEDYDELHSPLPPTFIQVADQLSPLVADPQDQNNKTDPHQDDYKSTTDDENYTSKTYRQDASKLQTSSSTLQHAGHFHRSRYLDPDGKPLLSVSEMMIEIDHILSEKRSQGRRPDLLESMSREQLSEEKLTIQKTLLRYEGIYGRPESKQERDIMRPLYDRYRSVKRLINVKTPRQGRGVGASGLDSPPTVGGVSGAKVESDNLVPIIEGEPMETFVLSPPTSTPPPTATSVPPYSPSSTTSTSTAQQHRPSTPPPISTPSSSAATSTSSAHTTLITVIHGGTSPHLPESVSSRHVRKPSPTKALPAIRHPSHPAHHLTSQNPDLQLELPEHLSRKMGGAAAGGNPLLGGNPTNGNNNLHELPLTDLLHLLNETRAEKRHLRRVLKNFEDSFQRRMGRRVEKDDRIHMEVVYTNYKHIKGKLRLLEALVSKHEQYKSP